MSKYLRPNHLYYFIEVPETGTLFLLINSHFEARSAIKKGNPEICDFRARKKWLEGTFFAVRGPSAVPTIIDDFA